MMSETIPEGYEEWGSFARFGDTIARQTEDGQWEYSADGGETWTNETPDGFSVNEDGTRSSIGGDGEDLRNILRGKSKRAHFNPTSQKRRRLFRRPRNGFRRLVL